jgi:hypothetical protein
MDDDKISAALERCLKAVDAGDAEHPFLRIKDFLNSLREDPTWSDAEVIEVQTNVIEALTSRLVLKEKGGLASDTPES